MANCSYNLGDFPKGRRLVSLPWRRAGERALGFVNGTFALESGFCFVRYVVTAARRYMVTSYSGALGIGESIWVFKSLLWLFIYPHLPVYGGFAYWVPKRRPMRRHTASLAVQPAEIQAPLLWGRQGSQDHYLEFLENLSHFGQSSSITHTLQFSPLLSPMWKGDDSGLRPPQILGATPPASCVIPGAVFFLCNLGIIIPTP